MKKPLTTAAILTTLAFFGAGPAAADADDDLGSAMGPLRAQGDTEVYPDSLCGASPDTGLKATAVATSVGRADWRFTLVVEYIRNDGAPGTTTRTTSFTTDVSFVSTLGDGTDAPAATRTLAACGPWLACDGTATLEWWNGFDWVTKGSASGECLVL